MSLYAPCTDGKCCRVGCSTCRKRREAQQGGRVLVCGGRAYTDASTLYRVLDKLRPALVIHGAARGADLLADAWARGNKVPVESYPITKADWDQYKLGAGPRRNILMLERSHPDKVIAFPGGNGTAHMTRISLAAKVPTFAVLLGGELVTVTAGDTHLTKHVTVERRRGKLGK